MTRLEAETAAITLIMLGECDGMERDLIELIRSGELWNPGENMLLKCAVFSLQFLGDGPEFNDRFARAHAQAHGVDYRKVEVLRNILKKLNKEAGEKGETCN